MQAASGVGEEQGGGGNDLTAVRRALFLAIWLPFTAYAFGPWSPGYVGDPNDFEILTHLCEFVWLLLSSMYFRVCCRFGGPPTCSPYRKVCMWPMAASPVARSCPPTFSRYRKAYF